MHENQYPNIYIPAEQLCLSTFCVFSLTKVFKLHRESYKQITFGIKTVFVIKLLVQKCSQFYDINILHLKS